MPLPGALKPRAVCQYCREKHRKCDEQASGCIECLNRGLQCVRQVVRFNHGGNPSIPSVQKCDYEFARDQQWCSTARKSWCFRDETLELQELYDAERTSEDPSTPQDATVPAPVQDENLNKEVGYSPSNRFFYQSSHEDNVATAVNPITLPRLSQLDPPASNTDSPTSLSHSPVHVRELSHISPNEHNYDGISSYQTPLSNLSSPVQERNSPYYPWHQRPHSRTSMITPWPIQDLEQATLMRYFIEVLASDFDLTDQSRNFRFTVPIQACTSPTLFNAIMAAAARHRSRTSDFDPSIADRYHHACLELLIPVLSDDIAVLDENLLAATVILRFLEEIEVPTSLTSPPQNHLLGLQAFMSAHTRSPHAPSPLAHASFWVGLRQEIYMAVTHQRPIAISLRNPLLDWSFSPTCDGGWANRIVAHCADVVRYCFGGADEQGSTYEELLQYREEWERRRPGSWEPVYWEWGQGQMLPKVWLIGDAVVIGMQHACLARMLLAAHNPGIPRLGAAMKKAVNKVEREVRRELCMICGIAESIDRMHPAYVTASMAIAVAGDVIHDASEQQVLIDILEKTEREYAWTTFSAQKFLKDVWGWTPAGDMEMHE